MIIAGKEIFDKNFLKNTDESNLINGSYYLTIHTIIPITEPPQENYAFTKHFLQPGGLAWIVSEEIFSIPDPSITALVTLSSRNTRNGLLALDVGLVDAYFEGPIGSMVINFSKVPVPLFAGDRFFRVMFLKHNKVEEEYISQPLIYTHETYIRDRLDFILKFPTKFLQIDEIENRIEKQVTAAVDSDQIVKKLESKVMDNLLSALFKKYWPKIVAGLIFLLIAAFSAKPLGQLAFNKFFSGDNKATTSSTNP